MLGPPPLRSPGRASRRRRSLLAPLLLIVGGTLQVLLGWVASLVVLACVSLSNLGCVGYSVLLSLPLITGIAALLAGVVLLSRPGLARLLGPLVTGLSGTVIVLGFVLLGRYPVALVYVLVLLAWPLFPIFAGGVLALLPGGTHEERPGVLPAS